MQLSQLGCESTVYTDYGLRTGQASPAWDDGAAVASRYQYEYEFSKPFDVPPVHQMGTRTR
eukprot:scaffold20768_cov40-Prasinocladus_malaysianus.AAC.2